MKVDKSNPKHWLYLSLFGLNTVIAVILRPLTRSRRTRSGARQIILYGHRLSGNLLALYRHINKNYSDEFHVTFLTMDPDYHKRLHDEGVNACRATRPSAIRLMYTADAVISDHGLHSMVPLLWLSDVKFFDVWHAIPFKGFDDKDFRIQHLYTETWVASPLLAKLYEEKFGFPEKKIYVTGYARTDSIVNPQETDEQIRKRFGLQDTGGKKLVLFAPTWKQDATDRTLFPFGVSPKTFLRDISRICREQGAVPLIRTHINTQMPADISENDVKLVPFNEFPDTEALLQITHILICDWSSIAFDFLLLNRPSFFLDVPPPFKKGFSLGKDFRYGPIIKEYRVLLRALANTLANYEAIRNDLAHSYAPTTHTIYGKYADGRSADRCLQRLMLNTS